MYAAGLGNFEGPVPSREPPARCIVVVSRGSLAMANVASDPREWPIDAILEVSSF